MDTPLETLAAWLDGEPVSRADVTRALETADGREYVLDLMALRHMVVVTTPLAEPRAVPGRVRRWPALAAAAAILLCVAGGFAVGRFVPSSSSTSGERVSPVATPSSIAAPTPTRVIQLGESTDWRESVGGS